MSNLSLLKVYIILKISINLNNKILTEKPYNSSIILILHIKLIE